jgi:ketosteroid isomerase-like protein
MSEENVEIVRVSIATYNAEGLEASMAYLHPDVEWFTNAEAPDMGAFRGHDGIRRLAALLEEVLGDVRIEPDRFVDAGDQVVVLGRLRVTGTGSGAATESRRAWVYTLRHGKIIRHLTFADEAEALQAVRRSEQDTSAKSS